MAMSSRPQSAATVLPTPEPVDVAAANQEAAGVADRLEHSTPDSILEWAVGRFGATMTMATSFGPEGCAMIDMIARRGWKVDIFTLDTGLFFPETYALWKAIEERYRVRIRAVSGISLAEQEREHGPLLWQREPGLCCQLRKVLPLRAELPRFSAWLTGIRRDQTAVRGASRVVSWDATYGLFKVNPLLNLSEADVWSYIKEHDVPTNPLHKQGYASIGCHPCTTPVAPGESSRAGRWRGQEKTECGIHVDPVTGRLGPKPGNGKP